MWGPFDALLIAAGFFKKENKSQLSNELASETKNEDRKAASLDKIKENTQCSGDCKASKSFKAA